MTIAILPFGPLAPDLLDLDIDVAVILVPFPDGIDVLFELGLVEPSGFIDDRIERPALGLHLLAQNAIAELCIPFEKDVADDALLSFVDRVDHAGSSARFIRLDLEFDVDVGEALRLIGVDDFLPPFLELLFTERGIDLQVDVLAQTFSR